MFEKIKNTLTVRKEEIHVEDIYNELFNQLMNDLDKKYRKNLNYLKKYPQYSEALQELLIYYRFIKDYSESYTPVLITFEGLEEETTHAEEFTLDIIKEIHKKHVNNENERFEYELNIENIKDKNFFDIETHLVKVIDIEKSYIKINNLNSLNEYGSEYTSNFTKLLKELSFYITLMLRGNKEDVNSTLSSMKKEPHFRFRFSIEYSYEEVCDRMYNYFIKRGFVFEDGWEESLKVYLHRDSNTIKDFSYYFSVVDYIQKKLILDLNHTKSSGKIVIKKEYFETKKDITELYQLNGLNKLNKMIGLEDAKKSVKELIAYLEFEQKMRDINGKSFPLNLHMLFTGSPGTGKTTLARITAEILFELGYIQHNNLVEVDAKELVSQWVGDTAIKTNEVIQKARGGVLFIDEAYSIIGNQHGREAIAVLIKAMEDLKRELVVIFAGYQDEMKKFVLSNPGIQSRIGNTIHFNDYNEQELIEIYNVKLNDYQITTEISTMELLKDIIRKDKSKQNFGNGRFIDNLIQEILFQHAVNTVGINDKDILCTITNKDIPKKYQD